MSRDFIVDLVIKKDVCGQVVENINSALAVKYRGQSDIRHNFGSHRVIGDALTIFRDKQGIEPDEERLEDYSMFVSKDYLVNFTIYTDVDYWDDALTGDKGYELVADSLDELIADTARLDQLIKDIDWDSYFVIVSNI